MKFFAAVMLVFLAVACKEDAVKTQNTADLKNRLTAEQYRVTQECGTEPPFSNAFWDNHESGLYVDVVSGEPLFSSIDKFDSGSGWPSFTRPVEGASLIEKIDTGLGMERIEVRSSKADSHLGHLFPDGPDPTGLRYCINSAALRFIPEADLKKEGYGEFARLFASAKTTQAAGKTPDAARETAYFAAGCFWGTEGYFRQLEGVLSTEVGYSGGTTEHPTYEEVCTGRTGHAETIKIEFDPGRIAYRDLLRHFFRMHDPTTVDRQGADIGSQYRSAVFFTTAQQEITAKETIAELQAGGEYRRPIVTETTAAGPFWPAEQYHQDYLEKNPSGYCHVDLKLAKKPLNE